MNRPKELLLFSSFVYVFSMSRNNLIKALCTFKEIPSKVNFIQRCLTNRFRPMVRSAPSKKIEKDYLTLESMVFRITLGSDARKMSLWKHWDYRQAEDKIEE